MELYDGLIRRIEESLDPFECRTYRYDGNCILNESENFTMLFQSDTALELGSTDKHAVNLTCVTSDKNLVTEDSVRVVGADIGDIKRSSDYARICEVLVGDEDEGDGLSTVQAHRLLQDMDFVKFHVYPENIMIRTSGQSSAERVRVGKKAVADGISFEKLGCTYISHYKKDPRVLAVRIAFITDPAFDYGALKTEAALGASVINSLSMIQKGLPKDCDKCTISDICGEIEGLKKLHFG